MENSTFFMVVPHDYPQYEYQKHTYFWPTGSKYAYNESVFKITGFSSSLSQGENLKALNGIKSWKEANAHLLTEEQTAHILEREREFEHAYDYHYPVVWSEKHDEAFAKGFYPAGWTKMSVRNGVDLIIPKRVKDDFQKVFSKGTTFYISGEFRLMMEEDKEWFGKQYVHRTYKLVPSEKWTTVKWNGGIDTVINVIEDLPETDGERSY